MAFLKSWFSQTFCIVVGKGCPPQYKMYGKTMILKMAYLVICICNLFEILKEYACVCMCMHVHVYHYPLFENGMKTGNCFT